MLKNIVLAVPLLATVTATEAAAERIVDAYIEDVYTQVYVNEPYTIRECKLVRSVGDAAGGALMGMIIGGILGQGVSGNDQGAAAGAVIGGIVGADKGAQNGGQLVEKCTNVVYNQQMLKSVYDYTYITFTYEGKEYTLSFIK